ncbi:hypothetical protein NDU88_005611 [Pleurodeles waltl]|uniref:Uncharacterized protein n=1 Tax=Pleurodeles waltl TaxID=8319 RepID=A0AAV7SME2_PLEWA|nr:hypothetical protein NDU88_005611 [Pleurodeles waltl]
MTAGGTDIATTLSWLRTARRPGRRSTARGAVYSLDRLAAAQATPRRSLFFLLFGAGISTRVGVAEVLGWFLMKPKTLRTPRMGRGKLILETNAGRRNKKQSAALPKTESARKEKEYRRAPWRWRNHRIMLHRSLQCSSNQ